MRVSEDDIKSLKESRTGIPYVHDATGRVYAVEGDPRMEFICSLVEKKYDLSYWHRYKEHCRIRREWGKYLRSNLEWDWDVASCLKRLFDQSNSRRWKYVQQLESTQAAIAVNESGECKLSVSIDNPCPIPPKMVEVQYKAETGELKCIQYFTNPHLKDFDLMTGAGSSTLLLDEGSTRLMSGTVVASGPLSWDAKEIEGDLADRMKGITSMDCISGSSVIEDAGILDDLGTTEST